MAAILSESILQEFDTHQLHPLQHPSTHANAMVVERADGVYLHTPEGRKVLDGMAGLWNVNIGYGNQALPEAAREQMSRLAYTSNFTGMTNVPSSQLAKRLAGLAHPTLNTTFFTSGGSEANDTAFKTARYYWQRLGRKDKTKIIARQSAYHGITLAATYATGLARYHTMFGPPLAGFLHTIDPYPYRLAIAQQAGESVGAAAARALAELIEREGPDTVAAFIAEPVQGVGGVIVPPDDYFPLVRAVCDKYDVLLIMDEVICGFGRTGRWFGSQHWGLRPDMLAFAKGVTSGYLPLGGLQISDAVREVVLSAPASEMWMHGYTYSGHAACCAVGLKNLEIIEGSALVERSRELGAYLLAQLQPLREFDCVGDVRGLGLLCGMEIVADRETRTPDPARATAIANACLARGVRTRAVGNSTLALSPPLIITRAEIDHIVQTFGAVLDSI
ncbi:MAG: aspartate aminotransferase family protein [Chloroflexi bacterium]|nr:MAG: aspartate aminotransferase family protein [Chloroflexota bacterium]RLT51928.1 MAG: aspartate aminotransferase family protein [Chloroflexota bacterium]